MPEPIPHLAITPRLAITMGDPAGIGPEIIVKALRRLAPRLAAGELSLLVIGHASALRAAQALLDDRQPIPVVAEHSAWPALALLPAGEEREPIAVGQSAARKPGGSLISRSSMQCGSRWPAASTASSPRRSTRRH